MSLKYCISNEERVSLLANLLKSKEHVRIIEVHSGISGLIANELQVEVEEDGEKKLLGFDGFWESSLTDSASKGLPDIELVSQDSRLGTINQILDVTDKPMIVDGDTGGDYSQFEYFVRRLERSGVSAVIIEDKIFPKRNSLEGGARQTLEDPYVFAEKLRRGKRVRRNKNFLIIARIEALIAGLSQEEAIKRAEIYLKAGADGIMIHSKSETPDEILEFAKLYNQLPRSITRWKSLICVPTAYNTIHDQELAAAGFNIIIHANHLLRASYKAMEEVAKVILVKDRSFEASPLCVTTKEIFGKVGFLDVKEKDALTQKGMQSKIKVIMPAAGADALSKELNKPKCLVEINGKCLLERQMEDFSKCGLTDVVLVRGFNKDQIQLENIRYYDNADYEASGILESVFKAKDELNSPVIISYADVLVNRNIIQSLVELEKKEAKADIVIVVDESFEQYKGKTNRNLELVTTESSGTAVRRIIDKMDEKVLRIGTKINIDSAVYEFIGLAYFSKNGITILKQVYQDCLDNKKEGGFHEAVSFEKASFTDIIQEIIDRGYEVNILKTYKGWMEIHDRQDIEMAKEFYR